MHKIFRQAFHKFDVKVVNANHPPRITWKLLMRRWIFSKISNSEWALTFFFHSLHSSLLQKVHFSIWYGIAVHSTLQNLFDCMMNAIELFRSLFSFIHECCNGKHAHAIAIREGAAAVSFLNIWKNFYYISFALWFDLWHVKYKLGLMIWLWFYWNAFSNHLIMRAFIPANSSPVCWWIWNPMLHRCTIYLHFIVKLLNISHMQRQHGQFRSNQLLKRTLKKSF